MTDSRMPPAKGAFAPAPGLQLIGSDTEAGLCVDGYCVLPGQRDAENQAEKSD